MYGQEGKEQHPEPDKYVSILIKPVEKSLNCVTMNTGLTTKLVCKTFWPVEVQSFHHFLQCWSATMDKNNAIPNVLYHRSRTSQSMNNWPIALAMYSFSLNTVALYSLLLPRKQLHRALMRDVFHVELGFSCITLPWVEEPAAPFVLKSNVLTLSSGLPLWWRHSAFSKFIHALPFKTYETTLVEFT